MLHRLLLGGRHNAPIASLADLSAPPSPARLHPKKRHRETIHNGTVVVTKSPPTPSDFIVLLLAGHHPLL